MNSHGLFHSAGSTAGDAWGRLCPLHQPVPRLRAAGADGPPIALLLRPGNHGRVQRSATSPQFDSSSKYDAESLDCPLVAPLSLQQSCLCCMSVLFWKHVFWHQDSPCFACLRDVQGQEWTAEDVHLHGLLQRDGSHVYEAICWYLSFHSFHMPHSYDTVDINLPRSAIFYAACFTIFLGPDEPFIYSHPKLEKLEEVVLQHFRLWAESAADNKGDLLNIALLCCDSYVG